MDLELPVQIARHLSESRGGECYVLDVSSLRELERVRQRGVEGVRSFESVLVVGHSNEEGIEVSREPGGFLSWSKFGEWLSEFEPWVLVLVACNAGRSTCGRALFAAVPSLERVLGCPTPATKGFGTAVVAALGGAGDEWLDGRRTALAQLATGMVTGQVLTHWWREDTEDPLAAAFLDVVHQVSSVVVSEATRDLRVDLRRAWDQLKRR